jgi:hypothetical protein
MRKDISFAIAATILGLAMVFWAISSVAYTNADIVRPKVELSSSAHRATRFFHIGWLRGNCPGLRVAMIDAMLGIGISLGNRFMGGWPLD